VRPGPSRRARVRGDDSDPIDRDALQDRDLWAPRPRSRVRPRGFAVWEACGYVDTPVHNRSTRARASAGVRSNRAVGDREGAGVTLDRCRSGRAWRDADGPVEARVAEGPAEPRRERPRGARRGPEARARCSDRRANPARRLRTAGDAVAEAASRPYPGPGTHRRRRRRAC